MKKWFGILMIGLVGALVLGGAAVAEDPARSGEVHGAFVRLTEVAVGDGEYLGIVVKPQESDDHVTIVVPREPRDVANVARKLRKGQKVEIAFITDGGQRWLKGLQAQWRDAEGGKVETGSMVVRLHGGERRVEVEHRRTEEKREGDRRVEVDRRRDEPRREGERREERGVSDRPLPPRGERLEREPSRGLAGQLEQLANQIRQFAERLRRMENEIRELRTENERLKRMLRQRDSRGENPDRRDPDRPRQRDVRRDVDRPRDEQVRGDRPDDPRRRPARDGDRQRRVRPSLPDGMAGFRGVLIGSVKRKLDRGFLLKVDRLGEVWENNKADNPRAAVGKEVMITIRSEGLGERFGQILRKIEIGQKVLVEVFHSGGNQLTAIEQFKAID